ncbi:putative o-methyltransferase [Schistosoma mansoni]|eukprot:XP_018653181.1 putative o-methyltransferase [Schistosoma mansoni]
MVRTK